jgi:hypothetical protein
VEYIPTIDAIIDDKIDETIQESLQRRQNACDPSLGGRKFLYMKSGCKYCLPYQCEEQVKANELNYTRMVCACKSCGSLIMSFANMLTVKLDLKCFSFVS